MEADISRTDAGSLVVFFVGAFQDLRTLAVVSMNFWWYYWQVLCPECWLESGFWFVVLGCFLCAAGCFLVHSTVPVAMSRHQCPTEMCISFCSI